MRIGDIIGTVTLNRSHPNLTGGRFKLVVPLSLADLTGRGGLPAEELTIYDEIGAGVGCRVAFTEGREAAQPFHPEVKPIDAYCAAILDTVSIVSQEEKEKGEERREKV
jgi:ethanolamine utilization protein EutN